MKKKMISIDAVIKICDEEIDKEMKKSKEAYDCYTQRAVGMAVIKSKLMLIKHKKPT